MTDIILYALFGAAVIVVIYRLMRLSALRCDAATAKQPASYPYTSPHLTPDEMISRHASDESLIVTLTAGPSSILGRRELLKLIPGRRLWLEHSDFSGIERVKVYSGSYMIGELLLTDAEQVISIMETCDVIGSFVYRQNSPNLHEIDMQIVIYHTRPHDISTDDEASQSAVDRALTSPYIVNVSSLDNPRLFQN